MSFANGSQDNVNLQEPNLGCMHTTGPNLYPCTANSSQLRRNYPLEKPNRHSLITKSLLVLTVLVLTRLQKQCNRYLEAVDLSCFL